jgi:biofilm protein TabA
MILDTLNNAGRYVALHRGFRKAFAFLRRRNLAALPDGRCPVAGTRVYAMVSRGRGRGRKASPLEAHRQYVDIQYMVSGDELIGWRDRKGCRGRSRGYSRARDIEFFKAEPAAWVRVPPGSFAVFFPEDAHAPLAGRGPVHKVVVKVAI